MWLVVVAVMRQLWLEASWCECVITISDARQELCECGVWASVMEVSLEVDQWIWWSQVAGEMTVTNRAHA